MTSVLIATTNPGKIREILPILAGTSVELLTLRDMGAEIAEPEETGQTFAENALLKSRYYAAATGLTTVAEDSGLAIDALGGRPGIFSARYPGATYPDKFQNLWTELAPYPQPWTARYVCALALVAPSTDGALAEPLFECTGEVVGEIATTARGSQGFGYDPIFYFPEYAATFGEVDDARKAVVAHRGKAFRVLRNFLVAQSFVGAEK